jgi:hypothetical protein
VDHCHPIGLNKLKKLVEKNPSCVLINYVEQNSVIGVCKVDANDLFTRSVRTTKNSKNKVQLNILALRKTILRAHRQAWCWQDGYQGLTLADIRRLEDETQRELNKRMAQFQNETIRLSLSTNIGENENSSNEMTNDINQPLTIRRSRQMSIDNMNASRPRFNSFPVPPLPREETIDDEFFDAECKIISDFLIISIALFFLSCYRRSINFTFIS